MTFIETPLSGAAYAIRHGNTSWTVARELEVRKLWRAGYTASRIALELGGVTRNAVIGKLNRLGMRMNSRTPGVTLTCDPTARIAGSKPGQRPDGFRRKPDKRPQSAVKQLFAAPAPEVAPDIPAHQRVPLQALTRESCRYPIGDPGQPDFGFCDSKHAPGLPYCSSHARIAYRRPS